MIEDKTIGLKVTESADETLWINQKKALEDEIQRLENLLKVDKIFLEKVNEVLKQFSGNSQSLSVPSKL